MMIWKIPNKLFGLPMHGTVLNTIENKRVFASIRTQGVYTLVCLIKKNTNVSLHLFIMVPLTNITAFYARGITGAKIYTMHKVSILQDFFFFSSIRVSFIEEVGGTGWEM